MRKLIEIVKLLIYNIKVMFMRRRNQKNDEVYPLD